VSAASTAICAVSCRGFHDENDVGVHAEVATAGALEGEADLPVHLHLIDAGERVLDGSSAVWILTSGVFTSPSAE